ncbi:MAG: tetratricopeptide repeat protein, partial [Kofleriaceae bacterium]
AAGAMVALAVAIIVLTRSEPASAPVAGAPVQPAAVAVAVANEAPVAVANEAPAAVVAEPAIAPPRPVAQPPAAGAEPVRRDPVKRTDDDPAGKAHGAIRRIQAPRPASGKPAADKPAADKLADKPEKINVDDVFRAGLQAWVHGDTKTALASYKRVIQANASFAPAWRGIGLVHEKLGDRASARAAFQKYLQLAPAAGDAANIRARLEAP